MFLGMFQLPNLVLNETRVCVHPNYKQTLEKESANCLRKFMCWKRHQSQLAISVSKRKAISDKYESNISQMECVRWGFHRSV